MSRRKRQLRAEQAETAAKAATARPNRRWWVPFLAGCVVTGVFGSLLAMEVLKHPRPQPLAIQPERSAEPNPPKLAALLAMTDEQLAKEDLGLMNLRCAEGLPGASEPQLTKSLTTLDEWAKYIKQETDRHLYRVRQPEFADIYKKSEAYFRVTMMIQVLQEDLGVHYNKQRIDEVDFKNSQDLFIHGLVGSDNGGTCVSLPVLYTAMGRRLGYPIKLVLTKSHVFCRWDGPKERFNIEASGQGFATFDDEYYTTWPHKLTPQQVERGRFLKSLTPREELAVFLAARGHCLEDNGKFEECLVAYSHANAMAPKNPVYLHYLNTAIIRPQLPRIRAEQMARKAREQARRMSSQAQPQYGGNQFANQPHNPMQPFQETGYRGPQPWDQGAPGTVQQPGQLPNNRPFGSTFQPGQPTNTTPGSYPGY